MDISPRLSLLALANIPYDRHLDVTTPAQLAEFKAHSDSWRDAVRRQRWVIAPDQSYKASPAEAARLLDSAFPISMNVHAYVKEIIGDRRDAADAAGEARRIYVTPRHGKSWRSTQEEQTGFLIGLAAATTLAIGVLVYELTRSRRRR